MAITKRFASENYVTENILTSKNEVVERIDMISEQVENISNELNTMISNIEPNEDDVPRVYIDGVIPTTKNDALATLTYISNTETFHSYIIIKCQGTSSMSYPKKNFTIKLYEDVERTVKLKKNFRGWGSQYKFCLKANYIDSTHARNIICARLWSKACSTRDNLNERLAEAPNNGAIDGFHIKVYANGVYQGLYTWNIPKDGWMFGMDDNGDEAVYCCEVQTEAGQFRQEILADGSDWSLEYPDAEEVNDSVLNGFNNLVRIIKDTTDEEFVEQISSVLDIEAAIDYYLFCYYFAALDQLGKNMIMITYDGGTTWIPSAYDNDSTWGSHWDGKSMVSYNYACPEQYECSQSLLWERIENLFGERLYNRYIELTGANAPWSLANIITEIEEFYDIPRNELYAEDRQIFTDIPNNVTLSGMRTYMANRKPYVDKCIREIGVYVTLETIEFQKSNFTLGAGDMLRLRMYYVPEDSSNKNIIFASSNDNVIKIERDGEFVLLSILPSQESSKEIVITATSEENPNITSTLTLMIETSSVMSYVAPFISFDSDDYNNGTWNDSKNNKTMIFDGEPVLTNDGVTFDGLQTCYFNTGLIGNQNITIEFLGTIKNTVAGQNILAIAPNADFNWSEIVGMWSGDNPKTFYIEHCTNQIFDVVNSNDDKKYVHFLLCVPSGYYNTATLYFDFNGRINSYTSSMFYSTVSTSYIGNKEGSNHFIGSIRKLNVYNYIPTVDEAREILGIPSVSLYLTNTITSDMMELGSLTNYEPLGSEVDWDEEIRTNNFIALPTDAIQLSLDKYYNSDRIYFYDSNYRCISMFVASHANQAISIPEDAAYIKFLLMTTKFTDINVSYYR